MILPNVYGEGQLFAFSALDGESFFSDDLCGTLLKEKVGIRFYLKENREIILKDDLNTTFNMVSSDYISFDNNYILFAKRNLLIGKCKDIKINSKASKKEVDGVLLDYINDEFICLAKDNENFAISYSNNKDEAIRLAKGGLALNHEEEISKKLDIYNKHHLDEKNKYAMLYAKCISVMKTQLYSSEDKFKTIYSTPDRLPHKKMWLWDSLFHSLGHRHLDINLAKDLIRSIFTLQDEDGFVPHMSGVNIKSSITQPPVIAYGAYRLYKECNDIEFLKEIYYKNKKFLLWCHKNRRLSDLYLYTWNTTNNPNCKCDESGMDNSSRFDIHEPLYAIDFASFMANDINVMKQIAKELGNIEDAKLFANWYTCIKEDINSYLYSKEDGFYFDYNINKKALHKVYSVASFLPLLAKVADQNQARELVAKLLDKNVFNTEFRIPSIARNDKTYGTDMWRGPVWINFNYLVCEGLRNYGYDNLALEIEEKTLEVVNDLYLKTGTIFEFYDSENKKLPSRLNRKGPPLDNYDFQVKIQTIRDYGWSTTLVFDLLNKRR